MSGFITKPCTKCGVVKPLEGFHKCARLKDGHSNTCKECRKVYLAAHNAGVIAKREANPPNLDEEKTCSRCESVLRLSDFPQDKNKRDGRSSICKACQREASAEWRKENPERASEYHASWRKANPDAYLENARRWIRNNPDRKRASNYAWARANPEKVRAKNKAWRINNPEKAMASVRAYQVRKFQDTMPLTQDQKDEVAAYYEIARAITKATGQKWEVDHIFPLRAKNSCGLHVPWNMQIIPAKVNRKKSNKNPEVF